MLCVIYYLLSYYNSYLVLIFIIYLFRFVLLKYYESLKTFIDTRVNSDISFYVNSYEISREYSTVSQFSNLGNTQNNLITLIGTDKLKSDLGTS